MAPATQVSVSASRLTNSVAATAPLTAKRVDSPIALYSMGASAAAGDTARWIRAVFFVVSRGGGANAAECTSSSSVKEPL